MTESIFETILVDKDGALGIITLNRPSVLNALNTKLLAELSFALLELERNADVRAIIVTGAGEKAFAAGADIGELNALGGAVAGADQARMGQSITRQIERSRTPVIMAVNDCVVVGQNRPLKSWSVQSVNAGRLAGSSK